jgi:hypothetical protein
MKLTIFLLSLIALACSQSITLQSSFDFNPSNLSGLRNVELETLNILRKLLGYSLLIINQTLNARAKDYAKKLFTDKS